VSGTLISATIARRSPPNSITHRNARLAEPDQLTRLVAAALGGTAVLVRSEQATRTVAIGLT
jgi:hypothetical protein